MVDGVQSWLVRLIQMVTINLVTPAHWINEQIFQVLHALPAIFPENFTNSHENATWNHEDTIGNPLHLALPLIALILFNRTRAERAPVGFLSYGTVLAAGFALLVLIQTSTIAFSIRYQLPLFVIAAPLIGKAFSAPRPPWLGKVIFSGLLLYTIPYRFFINMRPSLATKPGLHAPGVYSARPRRKYRSPLVLTLRLIIKMRFHESSLTSALRLGCNYGIPNLSTCSGIFSKLRRAGSG